MRILRTFSPPRPTVGPSEHSARRRTATTEVLLSTVNLLSMPSSAPGAMPVGMPPEAVPMAGEPIVELSHVSRIYRLGHVEVAALNDVSLTIMRGEFVSIVGASGSGKSTLMNIVGCLDRPTSGEYRLAGVPVSNLRDDTLAGVRSRTVGFVFQSYNLLPRTSALENVAAPLMYQGVGRRQRDQRARAALERLGLGDRLNHEPTELSGGQQQRVAIARALVTDPALLLADEPTGNLDSHSGADVLALLHELHRGGRTILLITHDASVAAAGTRQVHIADGRIIDGRLAA
jgi:putative ABC transport system ATP-binding protein